MQLKKRPLLIPQYMNSFRCLGTDCDDSCCIGWLVFIDRHTYKKYQKIKSSGMKRELDKNIARNRNNPTDDNYAVLHMRQDNSCPFLSGERLCRIQMELGEDFLSEVCCTYPRTANMVDQILEKSATMSCPEAARLALLNPKPMEFEMTEEAADVRNILIKRLNCFSPDQDGKPERYFQELREFTVDLLQNRHYSLEERLIILGMFYQNAANAIKEGSLASMPDLILEYRRLVDRGIFSEEIAKIPALISVQMKLLKELADQRVALGVSSPRYLELFAQFIHGIQYTGEDSVEEMAGRYQQAQEKHYAVFMTNNGYILEHYLVNYAFKNLFPFSGKSDIFDNYVMLVIHYAMIKLHLIGIGAFHEGLSQGLVIKFIQSFAKMVEHNEKYLDQVFALLEENGYSSMAYMAILIKN